MYSPDSVDIRKYNIPLDVIEHYILKYITYFKVDTILSGFRLMPKEHALIKYKIYKKRLVITKRTSDISYVVEGIKHREGDLPAVIEFDDFFYWYYQGVLHRDSNGPAMMQIHTYRYRYPYTNMIHVNNINAADQSDYSAPLISNVNKSDILYKNGNHPRPYGWAVVAFYDGVHFLDYYGKPVVDNGPIAVLKILGGRVMKNGNTINYKYRDEIIDTAELPDTYSNFSSFAPIKLINWNDSLPILI
jgi:hypothetical protein